MYTKALKSGEKKLIGITMGDPCGIGPEVILKALKLPEIRNAANYIIIGNIKVLCEIAGNSGVGDGIHLIRADNAVINSDGSSADEVNVLDIDNISIQDTLVRKPGRNSGRASVEYIMEGIDLALEGRIDALVTAPICKEAIKMAGFDFAGHTELLKEKTSVENVVMFMIGKKLKVSFVTTHLPLNEVSGFISKDNVFSTIKITASELKNLFDIEQPKIAVCGLNPHCGDGDRFGTEEREVIIPAIKRAQEIGIECYGPLSADTVFNKAMNGEYDSVVVQFHDQGAIPIKLLAFNSGVNITLGTPIIRTSPTHGTAFDIAGKGIANPGSMVEAIKTAVFMAETRS